VDYLVAALLPQLLHGLVFGAALGLLALGLTVIFGLLGVKVGWVEGIEFNVLGLVAGLDLRHPALKLPGFGRIGIDSVVTAAAAK